MALANTTAVSVRLATPSDAGAIRDCLRAAFDPYWARYTQEAFADTTLTAGALEHRLKTMTVAVAYGTSDAIVGTVAWSLSGFEVGYLRGMAVLPEWHGHGVASALLSAAEADLRRLGARCMLLDTTAPLERAVRFYTKQGFTPTGRVRDFFGMALFEYEKRLA